MSVERSPVNDYDQIAKAMLDGAAAVHGNQPGEPKKAVERIIDVIRAEGMAAGKEMPKRLPLGTDALAGIRNKCTETLKLCEEWENVITSTDI